MIKILKKQKGITLVELLVSMTIFLVVMTMSVSAFVSIIRARILMNAMTDVQQNARIALEQLTRLARQAEEVQVIKGQDGFFDSILLKFYNDGTNYALTKCFKVDEGLLKIYQVSDCADTVSASGLSLTSDDISITKLLLSDSSKGGIPPTLSLTLELESKDRINFGVIDKKFSTSFSTSVLLTGIKP